MISSPRKSFAQTGIDPESFEWFAYSWNMWWTLSSMVFLTMNLWTVVDLFCPKRWTLPMACNSLEGLRIGSTRSTWLASIRFSPLAPDLRGIKRTFTSSRFWTKTIFWAWCYGCIVSNYIIPYSNRISQWLTEFGPLPWQAKQTVSAVSASACHIGGPI